MSKVFIAWEKRKWWVGGKPTWRMVPPVLEKYPRNSCGPSSYCLRRMTNKKLKLDQARYLRCSQTATR